MGTPLKRFRIPPISTEFARERCADVGVLAFWCNCGTLGRERQAETWFPPRGICRDSVSRGDRAGGRAESGPAPINDGRDAPCMILAPGHKGRLRDDGGRPRILALTQHQHSGAGRNALRQAGILVINEVCACPGSTNASSES
jgi:hypothetical protein